MLLVKCQNGKSVKWKSFKTLSDAISNGKHVLRTEMASKSVTEWTRKKSVMHIGLKISMQISNVIFECAEEERKAFSCWNI
jgi:hypothetical protein